MGIFCIFILHILHINSEYAEQNRALLDRRLWQSAYSSVQQQPGSYCPVLHPPHRAYTAQGSYTSLIVAVCAEEIAADQSPGHGVHPPGISDGAFQFRMDNIWFCTLLLLFKIPTKTDTGMQYYECVYVSVLEEYKGPRKPGHILHILHILHTLICLSTSAWLDLC